MLLASSSDISSVDPLFVKNFLILVGWLVTTGGAIWAGRAWGRKGRSDDPLHLKQPVEIRKASEPAKKGDVEALRQSVAALSGAVHGIKTDLLTKGNEREQRIVEKVHAEANDIREKQSRQVADIHRRINEEMTKNAKHAEAIENLKNADHRHDAVVTAIQTQLAQILQRLPKPRLP